MARQTTIANLALAIIILGQPLQLTALENVPALGATDLFALAKPADEFFDAVPSASRLNVEKILAFEDNPRFAYLMGQTGEFQRRIILLKPSTFVIEDRMPAPHAGGLVHWTMRTPTKPKIDGRTIRVQFPQGVLSAEILQPPDAVYQAARLIRGVESTTEHVITTVAKVPAREARPLHVFQVSQPGKESAMPDCEFASRPGDWQVTVSTAQQTLKLSLPNDRNEAGTIAIAKLDGSSILKERLLPSGILPHGEQGFKMIDRWDAAYRREQRPGWDKGRTAPELRKVVEEEKLLKPGRAVELGCGAGTNAIYLAQQGFDVTAIDIAPTALSQARAKADKAGVNVRWILADVLAVPDLGQFDVLFDRGCYHGVRRGGAAKYVETVRRLAKPGARMLILAGNANEPKPHYGPPRVKEEELRAELGPLFEFEQLREIRFDAINEGDKGALAWSALLRRKSEP